ncbi:hypothetical protein THF1D04_480005 [Vibrio owensii]|uniref:Uncharacterized protein n=1 Tax=Vibrio owensii TaxID=696485 RepID=A0AAU9QC35_9VIBR|nr:hypothetical protein THF1D04_480005 [Vibrio owensii]
MRKLRGRTLAPELWMKEIVLGIRGQDRDEMKPHHKRLTFGLKL